MIKILKHRKPTASQLKILYQHAPWAKKRPLKLIARMLKHADLACAAWDGNRLAGFARCTTDWAFRAVLWDVVVDPAYRRRGLGAKLVKAVLSDSRLKSVDQVWLYTTHKQNFYRRLGFKAFPLNTMLISKKDS